MDVVLEILRWVLAAVALFWAAGTAVAETRLPQYWVRMWDFPRAQILVFALLTGGLYLAVTAHNGIDGIDWAVLLAMFAVVPLWQARWIVPYTPVAPREVLDHVDDGRPTIRVLITNVLQQNEKHDLWRKVIGAADADLIAIAEVDETWAEVARETLDGSHSAAAGSSRRTTCTAWRCSAGCRSRGSRRRGTARTTATAGRCGSITWCSRTCRAVTPRYGSAGTTATSCGCTSRQPEAAGSAGGGLGRAAGRGADPDGPRHRAASGRRGRGPQRW